MQSVSKTLGQRLADLNIEVGTAMTIDWQQVRIQASIQALGGLTSNPNFEQHTLEDVIAECVTLADALVAELKRSDDVYAECRRMDAINTASVCENMTKIQNEQSKKGGNDESDVH